MANRHIPITTRPAGKIAHVDPLGYLSFLELDGNGNVLRRPVTPMLEAITMAALSTGSDPYT